MRTDPSRAIAPARRTNDDPASLHARIRAEVEARILSGDWPPGHRIPSEHELARQFGCARMTVNKVLSQLAKGGLIERRRRAGSFVLRPRTQSAVLEIHDIGAEVQALGLAYRFEVLERRKRRSGAADVARLPVALAAPVLDLTCRHFAAQQPFCLERRLISLDTVPEAAAADFADRAPGPWLLGRVPWTSAEHTISAAAADADVAALLRQPTGTACLAIERRTWSGGRAVTWARFDYPGEAHRIIARFEPAGQ